MMLFAPLAASGTSTGDWIVFLSVLAGLPLLAALLFAFGAYVRGPDKPFAWGEWAIFGLVLGVLASVAYFLYAASQISG
jgi:drug/metabolite transporter (DMT)-like permease